MLERLEGDNLDLQSIRGNWNGKGMFKDLKYDNLNAVILVNGALRPNLS